MSNTNKLLPLPLIAIPGNSIKANARKKSKRYAHQVTQMQKDYGDRCQFCGIAQGGTELVNLDHNYDHNESKNFALACKLCEYVQLLDMPMEYSQHIVYLPQYEQNILNKLYWQWIKQLKVKENDFDIHEAIAELVSLTNQLSSALHLTSSFQDLCGLFISPYEISGLLGSLRWIPSIEFLKSFEIERCHTTDL